MEEENVHQGILIPQPSFCTFSLIPDKWQCQTSKTQSEKLNCPTLTLARVHWTNFYK